MAIVVLGQLLQMIRLPLLATSGSKGKPVARLGGGENRAVYGRNRGVSGPWYALDLNPLHSSLFFLDLLQQKAGTDLRKPIRAAETCRVRKLLLPYLKEAAVLPHPFRIQHTPPWSSCIGGEGGFSSDWTVSLAAP